MGNSFILSTDGIDVPQQLEDSRAQQAQIVDSLRRKRAALGVEEHAHLTLLRQNKFLRIRMNARSLKHRIRDRLRQRKFELEKLERAYRHTVNGKWSQPWTISRTNKLSRTKSSITCRIFENQQ